ncbi:YopX family protein [Heyndrickxia coagulans]|uniref:YopX family protein n=1 Tax=Heyndrickxia coagulans TaxID=1398 RepID=UPI002E224411|nr:YopX family protein [Heyndrickxia coagulans]
MREIKFRAWDEELKRMFYGTTEQFDDSLSFRFKHFETDEPVYMQYTGLCDKNGREIYEGDIVTFGSWDEDIEEEWRHTPALVEYKQNEAAFYLTRSCNIPLAHQKDIEVIGNIYEDPGLLVKSNVS